MRQQREPVAGFGHVRVFVGHCVRDADGTCSDTRAGGSCPAAGCRMAEGARQIGRSRTRNHARPARETRGRRDSSTDDTALMASQLVEHFARVARDTPDRTVLIGLSEERTLTAAELWAEYEAVRASLVRAGFNDREPDRLGGRQSHRLLLAAARVPRPRHRADARRPRHAARRNARARRSLARLGARAARPAEARSPAPDRSAAERPLPRPRSAA